MKTGKMTYIQQSTILKYGYEKTPVYFNCDLYHKLGHFRTPQLSLSKACLQHFHPWTNDPLISVIFLFHPILYLLSSFTYVFHHFSSGIHLRAIIATDTLFLEITPPNVVLLFFQGMKWH